MAALIAASALSCADGPFEGVNPNERGFIGTLTLVSSHDTVSALRPGFVVQVVSDPPVSGYTPRWEVTGTLIANEGDGAFRVTRPVSAITPVQITARFAASRASMIVFVVPDSTP